MKNKDFEDMGSTKYAPSTLDRADGVTIVPAAMETPTKSVSVVEELPKGRLHAVKKWKPKGRK